MSDVKKALAPDQDRAHQKPSRRLIARLWSYLHPYRRIVLATLFLSLASGGLKVAQPLLAKRIIDVEIAARDLHGVMMMSMALLGLIVTSVVFEMAFSYLTASVGERAMHDLRSRLLSHVLRLDVSFFDRTPVGRLITRMTSDVGTLQELFSTGVVAVLGEVLVIIGVVGVMLYYSPLLTLVVALSAPFMMLAVNFFRRHARKWYLETRRALATVNAYLQENVAGIRTVQSFGRQARNWSQFSRLNDEYRVAQINTIFAFALFFPLMKLIGALTVAAVVWVGGSSIINARATGQTGGITFGQLFLFVQCVSMLFEPIRMLSEKYNLLQSAMASSERIFKLLDTQPSIAAPPVPAPAPRLAEAIRFEDVHFEYVPGEPILRGVSFEIPRGATVAVVGATGAGKSTLINLLTRFYDVTSGRVTVDGVPLQQFDPGQLRRMLAIVLQEVFLFSGTVGENLRLGNPALTDNQLWEILRQVHAVDFVAGLEGGLEARVTERGGTFSTGQKQLLAFARALAADPQVLILDEATANIDTETEWRIQQATQRLLEGRTALVVAHRLSTIHRADQILVMHRGLIAEAGTHQELMERGGIYWRLYQMQYHGQPEPQQALGPRG